MSKQKFQTILPSAAIVSRPQDKVASSERIQAGVEAFLEAGGKITQVSHEANAGWKTNYHRKVSATA